MTMSLVAVFIPVLFMGGIAGRLFREFAMTIIAITSRADRAMTHMLYSRLLKAHRNEGQLRAAGWNAGFEAMLGGLPLDAGYYIAHHRLLVLLCVFSAVASPLL